ncbi:lasso peptide biosynthesis protein [Kineococcus sp. SYSU DK005]|uniref:lasso peptide biosynthesis protein n=1 Tax=Kineococcus sp. SYSU DK005 TaxID=3383126 RepID=UPI003D7DA653
MSAGTSAHRAAPLRVRALRVRRRTARRAHLLTGGGLRAAWWAERSLRRVRAELPVDGLRTRVAPPPRLPGSALGAVEAVLRRRRATCLQRCLVVQAWLLAHGEAREAVVAVSVADGFSAHAWLDGHDADESAEFRELTRVPAQR